MPAVEKFVSNSVQAPARNAEAVTPHNTTELDTVSRALWVGGGGNITVLMADGQTVLISGIASGTLLPIQIKRVNSTGTTATLMVAFH
jgi:hypothetical protein